MELINFKHGEGFDASADVRRILHARVGKNVKIRSGCILRGAPEYLLLLGDDVYINCDCIIQGGSAQVTIGSRVTLAMGVYIHSDSGPNTSPALQSVYPITAGPVTIEDDVWIADRAVIMPGVTIGARSVIAANSLVTKNVPPGTLVGGTPARMLKQLVFPTDL